jgi:hypothetical protein
VVRPFVKMRRGSVVRILAFALLASMSALTLTPVCGSPLDVDAGKCCERRACHMTSAACNRVIKSNGPTHVREYCCSPTARNSTAPGGADQCCEHGRLIYPTVRPQSSASATIVLPLTPAIVLPPSTTANPFAERVVWEAALKIPIRPFYTLTATYRI